MNEVLSRRQAADLVNQHLPDALELEGRRMPLPARITAYVILAMFASFVVWASVSRVNRIAVANGEIVSSEPLAVVQPLEVSVIHRLLVKAGDTVTAGQTVAELDPTFVTADQSALEERKADLDLEVARLRAELEGTDFVASGGPEQLNHARLFAERRAEYESTLAGLDEDVRQTEAKLATNRTNQEAINGRVGLLRDIEAIRRESYERSYTSRLQLLQAEADTLSATTQLSQLAGEQQQLAHELASAQAKRTAFTREWRRKTEEQLVEAGRNLHAVTEEVTKARRKASLSLLTSPVDGTVMEIARRSVGSVLQPAEPLVTIVPAGAPLEAEVQIEALDRGVVRVGDAVRVKLDTFPFQRYGTLEGRLAVVSPDAARREPSAGGGTYFRGRVAFTPAEIRRFAAGGASLSPGMTVRAEIDAGRQSVIAYITYPVLRVMDESLREPR
ncbi:HlyD family type I secretion periplasmic adaptor subunit [Ancylobacter lacus]|uniref:HlyD family type I secretion periplasmic adaptor subunit n=1 Tax=Ancylobacter lacus TaxID=2579970 RepID=UPI001BCBD004|nr:HlyD family type I secretion periplasmic adaptor subunit [Ancylobacter lacus]MBS7540669.1 HlyD family type I secretion periplasmic adaptor subunit [Ancylobacter lacus]